MPRANRRDISQVCSLMFSRSHESKFLSSSMAESPAIYTPQECLCGSLLSTAPFTFHGGPPKTGSRLDIKSSY